MNFPIPTASSAATVPAPAPPQGQIGEGGLASIPDINKIRDLAEQIRQRCSHAHLAGQQQQAINFQVESNYRTFDNFYSILMY